LAKYSPLFTFLLGLGLLPHLLAITSAGGRIKLPGKRKSLIRDFQKLFADKEGKIVLWQTPNLPLVSWFVFMILSKILSHGFLKTTSGYISFGFIVIWALLEIIQGASYFRRFLGAVVLLMSVYSRLH
jgi:hypothetical protein